MATGVPALFTYDRLARTGNAHRILTYFFLISLIFVPCILWLLAQDVPMEEQVGMNRDVTLAAIFILFVSFIGLIVPTIVLIVRRLHDIGMSGWLLLILLIPYVGLILLAGTSLLPGTVGPNSYGDDPRGRVGRGRFF